MAGHESGMDGNGSARSTGESADGRGLDALLAEVYDELHALAESVLHNNPRGFDPTRTTSIVNDVYVRLARRGVQFQDRSHFLCLAARAMRYVLIDRIRRVRAAKRGDGAPVLSLDAAVVPAADGPDLLAIDDALQRLAELDPTKAKIVELRFFGGLSVEETASAASLSVATVKREWALARAWLFRELADDDAAGS